LYDEDEVSSVSGQHCTIQYDRGNFLVTDDNSANGTTVNGELLPPNNPRRLKDGDEIVLGDLFHRGAKLIFEARESLDKAEPMAEGKHTVIDSDFREPILPTVGSETILDLEDDPFGTVTDELPEIDIDAKESKDSDWLDDLE
jgi:pSer/pThr/pTyr-binding forkhead associated (FHA) protein